MTLDVDALLREILELEPELAGREAELRAHIEAIVRSKPDVPFTQDFHDTLRAELAARFHHTSLAMETPAPMPAPIPEPSSSIFSSFVIMQRFLFATGGAVLGALLVFAIVSQPNSAINPSDEVAMQPAKEGITAVAPKAFGTLAASDQGNIRGQGGGGGPEAAAVSNPVMADGDMAMTSDMGFDSKMMPVPFNVEYSYEGDIPLPQGDIEVLKRTALDSLPNSSSNLTGVFGSLFDWNSLGTLNVRSIQLAQPGKEPYSLYVDFVSGTVSINREIDYSKRPEAQCTDQACFDRYRMRIGDVPSDEAIIAVANAFTKDMGIDLSSHGDPVVQNEWRVWYEKEQNKDNYYIPESLTVVYPLEINGRQVYDEWGTRAGINVNVDLRKKEVTYVDGITLRRYESSTYAPATDAQQLRDYLKKGGQMYPMMEGVEQKVAKVGEPQEVYMRTYQWNSGAVGPNDLYVPALLFPVTDMPLDANTVRSAVIVPLAAEMLKAPEGGRPIPLDDMVR